MTKVEKNIEPCNNSDTKIGKRQKFTVSEAIATDFYLKNRIAAFRFYLIIRKDFSGKFHISEIDKLSSLTSHSQSYCRKMLRDLCSMGYLDKKQAGWYFVLGTRRYNLANGYLRPKMCCVPDSALKCLKQLRTFVYALHFSKAAKQAANRQGENKLLPLHRNGTSISYLARYTGVCDLTACRHRSRAQKFGFMVFRQQFTLLDEGKADKIKFWKEHHPLFYKCVISNPFPGVFNLLERQPSKMVFGISSKKRSLHFSQEEKTTIKALFIQKSSPALSKRNRFKLDSKK